MHSASASPPPAYDACTPDQWDTWYTAIGVLGDGGTDFGLLETVGQELRHLKQRAHRVAPAGLSVGSTAGLI